jgi:ArsR family transcriptional regulator, arsenate/arsenite/antimonite-responsive transcriptional repressor
MSKYRSKRIDKIAAILKALANPNRLRILKRLASCSEKDTYDAKTGLCPCVGDLGKDLGIAASTLSHHVKELRTAGLVRTERSGQKMRCRVDKKVLKEITDFLSETL